MATLRKLDGAWVLDWRDADGVRHRETLGRVGVLRESAAKKIVNDRNLELSRGFKILAPRSSPQFGRFAADYLAWHEAEYPDSHYRVKQIVESHLLPAFEFRSLDAFRPREIDAWKQKRAREAKGSTVGKELRTLKAMMNQAVAWELINRNPIQNVAEPRKLDSKPPMFYTVDELALLYNACRATVNNGEGPQPNPLRAAIWRLYANSGMRRKEGLYLKRQWVGHDAMKIVSSEDSRTKSGKWREIPLTEGAKQALLELPRDGEHVLPQTTAVWLSRACINDAKRAGLSGGIHTLRHTYGSHLVMAGVPLRTVQILMGHSSIAVTEMYAHLAPGHLQNAGKAISL
jgi:site-specific recombinase XerD